MGSLCSYGAGLYMLPMLAFSDFFQFATAIPFHSTTGPSLTASPTIITQFPPSESSVASTWSPSWVTVSTAIPTIKYSWIMDSAHSHADGTLLEAGERLERSLDVRVHQRVEGPADPKTPPAGADAPSDGTGTLTDEEIEQYAKADIVPLDVPVTPVDPSTHSDTNLEAQYRYQKDKADKLQLESIAKLAEKQRADDELKRLNNLRTEMEKKTTEAEKKAVENEKKAKEVTQKLDDAINMIKEAKAQCDKEGNIFDDITDALFEDRDPCGHIQRFYESKKPF